MAQFKQTTVFKLALLQEITQKNKVLLDKLVEKCGEQYKKKFNSDQPDSVDFEYMVGSVVFKGAFLENFLKEEGEWAKYFEGIKDQMSSEVIMNEVRSNNSSFDKVRKQNPSQANAIQLQALIDQKIPKMVKLAFMMKKAGKKGFSKAIVTALGEKELQKGVWVGLFRGMRDRGLSRTVGYGFKGALESGVVHATALAMQKSVLDYAKEHGLKHATKFKEMMKNVVATTAMVSAMTLTMAQMPSTESVERVVKVGNESSFSQAAPTIEEFKDFAKDIHIHQLPKVADVGGTTGETVLPLPDDVIEASFDFGDVDLSVKRAIEESVDDVSTNSFGFASKVESLMDGVPQDYTVKSGDNLWSVSADLVSQALKGREYILDEQGRFDNMVANVVKTIASENGIQNPDVIHPEQNIKLPTSIIDGIKAKLGLSDAAVDVLSSHEYEPQIKSGLAMKMVR